MLMQRAGIYIYYLTYGLLSSGLPFNFHRQDSHQLNTKNFQKANSAHLSHARDQISSKYYVRAGM